MKGNEHTQRAAFYSIVVTFVLIGANCLSQELKPLLTYENSLHEFYMAQRHAQREEFKEFKEKPIWKYLPDVGLQFGLPSIQFRVSNYFQFKRDQHLLNAKVKSIDAKLQLEMNEQIQALRIAYQKLQLDAEKMKLAKGRQVFLERLHAIDVECCKRNECTPEECHKSELAFYQAIETIRLKELDYSISILELERMARYNLPNYNFFK